jgi:hypothetical protein
MSKYKLYSVDSLLKASRSEYAASVKSGKVDRYYGIRGRVDESGDTVNVTYRPAPAGSKLGDSYDVELIKEGGLVYAESGKFAAHPSLEDARAFIESGGKRIAPRDKPLSASEKALKWKRSMAEMDALFSAARAEYIEDPSYVTDKGYAGLDAYLDDSGIKYNVIYCPGVSGLEEGYEVRTYRMYSNRRSAGRLVREYKEPNFLGKLVGRKPVLIKNPSLSEARAYIINRLEGNS